jgi:hypothetical protein
MLHVRSLSLVCLCALASGLGCASGPHPALKVAAEDLGCEEKSLTLHEIYPKKVKIEGCGKEGIFVEGCSGYGVTSECGWARKQ